MFFTFQVNLYIYNDIFHLVPAILPAGELFLYHHVSLKSYSTSKGKQHDIVSISRCFHLEHLLLFYFLVFVFYIALSVSTNRSNLSLLICTRFPFHNRYSAFGFSLTNLRSFPSPIRKYAAASSIDNVYLFHMNQAWIQSRARKQFLCHRIRLSFLRPHITKRSEGKIQWANAKNFIFLFLSLTYTKEERCFYRVLKKFFYFCAKNSYKTPFFEIL